LKLRSSVGWAGDSTNIKKLAERGAFQIVA